MEGPSGMNPVASFADQAIVLQSQHYCVNAHQTGSLQF